MKKQDLDNMAALDLFERACNDWKIENAFYGSNTERLRTCQAWVYETDNFYILRSYNTCVAAIDKESHYCADVLRYIYGYTATSAQHISKFIADYGDRTKVYRYR